MKSHWKKLCFPKASAVGYFKALQGNNRLFALISPLISLGTSHTSWTSKIMLEMFFAMKLNNTIWLFLARRVSLRSTLIDYVSKECVKAPKTVKSLQLYLYSILLSMYKIVNL